MLVYGDPSRIADPRREIAALRARLGRLDEAAQPVERHAALARLFIDMAELAQGLADAASARLGADGTDPSQEAATALVMRLAEALLASWRALAGQADPAPLDRRALRAELNRLEELDLPLEVRLKTGEGYAFYALYPEGYAEATAQLGASSDTTVIGIRSIGLGLACVAASALGAGPPVSVRPVGHPFHRQLQLTPALAADLQARAAGRFIVVDEGPGLSGSSFGAVADALEAMGVTRTAIAFLPSHGGALGAQASAPHQARWTHARRPCVAVDALLSDPERPGCTLAAWFADLASDGSAVFQDLSGGAWRSLRYAHEADWPAVNTHQERRKVLLTTARGAWLLKFSGLGASGERAFAHAQALADAGFAPAATALRYGFLAQPWLAASQPMRLAPEDRLAFAAHLGRYLGWRAAHLPAPGHAGAAPDALLEMARVNASEALGPGVLAARALDPDLWARAAPLRRVWTDNRLHVHEWLQCDGRWLKTDGVDHAAAHDLVGAQDIAWDVAGARVEFDLDAEETAALLAAPTLRAEVDPGLVALLEPAYLAFQLGACTLAAEAHAGWPQEQQRLAAVAAAYRERLSARLQDDR